MTIHEVIIFPGAGHIGTGTFDRGRIHGAFAEVELVDRYYRTMAEELDNSAIRHRVAPTRKAPGQSLEDFKKSLFPNSLVIECRIGWNDAKKVKSMRNFSALSYGEGVSEQFAKRLSDVMARWGEIYAYGHGCARPGVIENASHSRWITIEPFEMNGPKVSDYALWLPKLGTDIGRCLADYVRRFNESAGIKIQGYMEPKARNG